MVCVSCGGDPGTQGPGGTASDDRIDVPAPMLDESTSGLPDASPGTAAGVLAPRPADDGGLASSTAACGKLALPCTNGCGEGLICNFATPEPLCLPRTGSGIRCGLLGEECAAPREICAEYVSLSGGQCVSPVELQCLCDRAPQEFVQCGGMRPVVDDSEPVCEGDGEWCDAQSGLCWQDPPDCSLSRRAEEASMWCDFATIAGRDDWRLPTIDELRTLLRAGDAEMYPHCYASCSENLPDGRCPVSDPGCLEESCKPVEDCGCCPAGDGPGKRGCYWNEALHGSCDSYLSRSPVGAIPETYWWLNFLAGTPDHPGENMSKYGMTRCVRDL
jgi:hypothetical protein